MKLPLAWADNLPTMYLQRYATLRLLAVHD